MQVSLKEAYQQACSLIPKGWNVTIEVSYNPNETWNVSGLTWEVIARNDNGGYERERDAIFSVALGKLAVTIANLQAKPAEDVVVDDAVPAPTTGDSSATTSEIPF